MRQALINENPDLCNENQRYVMRITGDDAEGLAQLGNFIDPEAKYPVIVTTSRLLSTGVDAQTCRLIVLDREVGSMTEFKQIVGRGTRVHEDTKKYYFTLIDFRKATNHFADPDFDGEPVQIYEPGEDDPVRRRTMCHRRRRRTHPAEPGDDESDRRSRPPDITISRTSRRAAEILYPRRARQHPCRAHRIPRRKRQAGHRKPARLLEEDPAQVLRQPRRFLKRWNAAERKQAIIEELADEGLLLDPLAEEVGKDLDPFDLICHVAFDQPPLTRRERADNVRKRDVFTKYGEQARAVLEALLQKYQDEGVTDLDDPRILKIAPFDAMGTPIELLKQFGGRRLRESRPRTPIRSLREGSLIHVSECSEPPSNPFKTSCARTSASMATPSASRSSAGCSSSRSSTTRTRNWS